MALAATAAGSTPETAAIRPSRPSSPTAAQSVRASGGMMPMAAMIESAIGRS